MERECKKVFVFDRERKRLVEERVWPKAILYFLYDKNHFLSRILRFFVGKVHGISWLYGKTQQLSWSKGKIKEFIASNGIDVSAFEKQDFTSFNDFFIRKLKKEARPIANTDVVAPADGRYFCYNDFSTEDQIIVKGQTLSLFELLGKDQALTNKYANAAMVVARLAPVDYHRFHTPVDGSADPPKTINGNLFSVSPIALRQSLTYITQNKRKICRIRTKDLGDVLFIAVGATNVGSIQFTFDPANPLKKGDELGYFSLGASLLICLFEKGRVYFSQDIIEQSKKGVEVLCKMGQPLGSSTKP